MRLVFWAVVHIFFSRVSLSCVPAMDELPRAAHARLALASRSLDLHRAGGRRAARGSWEGPASLVNIPHSFMERCCLCILAALKGEGRFALFSEFLKCFQNFAGRERALRMSRGARLVCLQSLALPPKPVVRDKARDCAFFVRAAFCNLNPRAPDV